MFESDQERKLKETVYEEGTNSEIFGVITIILFECFRLYYRFVIFFNAILKFTSVYDLI